MSKMTNNKKHNGVDFFLHVVSKDKIVVLSPQSSDRKGMVKVFKKRMLFYCLYILGLVFLVVILNLVV